MHKHNGNQISKWITVPCPCCNGNRKIINGQWLRNIRELAMLDQRTFGKETNTSGPYISDIERNRRDVPTDILEAYLRLK
jgi:hypothetical protein